MRCSLLIDASARGIHRLEWLPTSPKVAHPLIADMPPDSLPPAALAAHRQLLEYFAATRTYFELPLILAGTEFQLAVWKALLAIPYGTRVTYSHLAGLAARPKAIRAAASAVAANLFPVVVPCHRVVHSHGTKHKYAIRTLGLDQGAQVKTLLLALEEAAAERLTW